MTDAEPKHVLGGYTVLDFTQVLSYTPEQVHKLE
jgi:hypothetical protein